MTHLQNQLEEVSQRAIQFVVGEKAFLQNWEFGFEEDNYPLSCTDLKFDCSLACEWVYLCEYQLVTGKKYSMNENSLDK
jgi:hypothetical protein